MKILTVVADGAPGGGTTHVIQVARHLKECGIKGVYLVDKGSYLGNELRSVGHYVCEVRMFSVVAGLLMFLKAFFLFCKFGMFDVCHFHGSRARTNGLITSLFSKTTVYTVHGYHFHKNSVLKKKLKIILERVNYKFSYMVIYVCEYDRNIAKAERIMSQSAKSSAKNQVIYNGVEAEGNNYIEKSLDIVFVGRMVPQKNPMVMVDVLERVKFNSCEIIGDGPLLKEVKSAIKVKEISSTVNFSGGRPRDYVIETLRKSKVLVMPSSWEGFPILSLEAMANNCVVIAMDVGGLSEQIPSDCGFLIKEDEKNFRDKISDIVDLLLHDEQKRTAIATKARENVISNFEVKICNNNTIAAYKKIGG